LHISLLGLIVGWRKDLHSMYPHNIPKEVLRHIGHRDAAIALFVLALHWTEAI
jgi:hypothetical protein